MLNEIRLLQERLDLPSEAGTSQPHPSLQPIPQGKKLNVVLTADGKIKKVYQTDRETVQEMMVVYCAYASFPVTKISACAQKKAQNKITTLVKKLGPELIKDIGNNDLLDTLHGTLGRCLKITDSAGFITSLAEAIEELLSRNPIPTEKKQKDEYKELRAWVAGRANPNDKNDPAIYICFRSGTEPEYETKHLQRHLNNVKPYHQYGSTKKKEGDQAQFEKFVCAIGSISLYSRNQNILCLRRYSNETTTPQNTEGLTPPSISSADASKARAFVEKIISKKNAGIAFENWTYTHLETASCKVILVALYNTPGTLEGAIPELLFGAEPTGKDILVWEIKQLDQGNHRTHGFYKVTAAEIKKAQAIRLLAGKESPLQGRHSKKEKLAGKKDAQPSAQDLKKAYAQFWVPKKASYEILARGGPEPVNPIQLLYRPESLNRNQIDLWATGLAKQMELINEWICDIIRYRNNDDSNRTLYQGKHLTLLDQLKINLRARTLLLRLSKQNIQAMNPDAQTSINDRLESARNLGILFGLHDLLYDAHYRKSGKNVKNPVPRIAGTVKSSSHQALADLKYECNFVTQYARQLCDEARAEKTKNPAIGWKGYLLNRISETFPKLNKEKRDIRRVHNDESQDKKSELVTTTLNDNFSAEEALVFWSAYHEELNRNQSSKAQEIPAESIRVQLAQMSDTDLQEFWVKRKKTDESPEEVSEELTPAAA